MREKVPVISVAVASSVLRYLPGAQEKLVIKSKKAVSAVIKIENMFFIYTDLPFYFKKFLQR
jgi:hypothetical protein